jgi:hypothetical protein
VPCPATVWVSVVASGCSSQRMPSDALNMAVC